MSKKEDLGSLEFIFGSSLNNYPHLSLLLKHYYDPFYTFPSPHNIPIECPSLGQVGILDRLWRVFKNVHPSSHSHQEFVTFITASGVESIFFFQGRIPQNLSYYLNYNTSHPLNNHLKIVDTPLIYILESLAKYQRLVLVSSGLKGSLLNNISEFLQLFLEYIHQSGALRQYPYFFKFFEGTNFYWKKYLECDQNISNSDLSFPFSSLKLIQFYEESKMKPPYKDILSLEDSFTVDSSIDSPYLSLKPLGRKILEEGVKHISVSPSFLHTGAVKDYININQLLLASNQDAAHFDGHQNEDTNRMILEDAIQQPSKITNLDFGRGVFSDFGLSDPDKIKQMVSNFSLVFMHNKSHEIIVGDD
jgi:hypothetical protein